MKMKNLFKTAVFAGTLSLGCVAAINFAPSVDAANFGEISECASKSSFKPEKYFWDDGYSPLTHNVNYGNGNLLNLVQPGDIFFDADGSGGFSGHVAIIEGVYWDQQFDQAYIRTIEADGKIVRRNYLDLDKYVSRPNVHTIVRLNRYKLGWSELEETMIKFDAINFCRAQLGKGYSFNIFEYPHTEGDTWYCSELIWAAYYNATDGKVNFNIHRTSADKFMWPKEMRDAWEYVDDIGAYVIGSEVYKVRYGYADNDMYAIIKDGVIIGYEPCHYVTGSDARTYKCTKCGHVYKPGC